MSVSQPIGVETLPGLGGDTRERHTHPAFAMIGASRVQGSAYLFGSDFEHRAFVRIVIRRGSLERDLSHDWMFGGKELVEVNLSEAQWATMVSSMNMGGGVPCTLSWLTGEGPVPRIMEARGATDEFVGEMKETVASAVARVDEAIRKVEALTGKLSKKRQDEVLGELRMARQDLDSNVLLVTRSFGEHVENRMEKAKVEFNAYLTGTLMRAGVESLKGEAPIALPPGKDGDDG